MHNSDVDNLVRVIDPPNIINWARQSGWDELDVDYNGKPLRILRNEEGEEIWVPSNRNVKDYERRIRESIKILARFESGSYEDITQEIASPPSDILRFSIKNDDTANGTIPLSQGIKLYDRTKKLLQSAADSVQSPDVRYHSHFTRMSQEYADKCKIGRSEIGSYTAKIISPFDFGRQGNLFEDEESTFSRKSVERLMFLLKHLSEKIDSQELDDIINPDEGDIRVTGNICEAITEMAPEVRGTGLNFRFDNSKTAPPPSENTPSAAYFDDHHLPYVKQIAEELKPSDEYVENEFVGKVKSLHGKPDDTGDVRGLVRLNIFVRKFSDSVTASVDLNPDDYQTACDAHKRGEDITLSGRLRVKEKKDRIHQFEGYTSFSIRD